MANGLPSGEQIEIHFRDQRVVVVEVGGGLRSYTVGDRELLDGYGDADMATAGRERHEDGLARVEVHHPDNETEPTLWPDESYPYLQLFTGESQPSIDRRSLAVEPMTCPPNAFRTGQDVLVLEPGEATTAEWGIHT